MEQFDYLSEIFRDNVLGAFSSFVTSFKSNNLNIDNIDNEIYMWNCQQISAHINTYISTNGLELATGRRLFVFAPNPKQSAYAIRNTHYYQDAGALCECEYDTIEEAVINCLINYPNAVQSPGLLDLWMSTTKFAMALQLDMAS